MSKQIQWFPGHMSKASREVQEKLKLVDLVVELVDARIPLSSANPMLDKIIENKPRLVFFTKADLADPHIGKQWENYYKDKGAEILVMDVVSNFSKEKFTNAVMSCVKEKLEKEKKKGLKPRSIRAMIVGIPNVGKSTLINKLAKRKAANVGNKPGVTKQQQWIRVGDDFELLDTPGILWPKFEDEKVANNIALIGSIKDQILPKDDVVKYGLNFMNQYYKGRLEKRYQLEKVDLDDIDGFYEHVGRIRGCLVSNNEVDYEKVSDLILNDIRSKYLGRITFDRLT